MKKKYNKKHNKKYSTVIRRLIVICVWLLIWQFSSMLMGLELILASPISVFKAATELIMTNALYITVSNSFLKITAGFIAAFFLAILSGIAAHKYIWIKDMLAPAVYLMKTLPVASFIIILLIWAGSANVSVFISFIVVFPMIYHSVLTGMDNCDKKLIEMSQVFGLNQFRIIRYIYAPVVYSYVVSNCKTALGMCWKAGIAAEVIGLPAKSIGSELYLTKLYLMTPSLMAWSFVIIIVSLCFEKLFFFLLKWGQKILES